MKRQIIKIDEEKCTGCGQCATGCPEGAIQIIDNKARLVSEIFCDGLGACIGTCPEGAISVEEREAEAYSESKTMGNIVKQGENTIRAHLDHLKSHGQTQLYNEAIEFLKAQNIPVPGEKTGCSGGGSHFGCPGSRVLNIVQNTPTTEETERTSVKMVSELRQWPIQLKLLPVQAPFFQNADLLIAADCVGFSNPNFHRDLLKGKTLIMGCPKLDDAQLYIDKLAQIFALNPIKSITIAIMEVPCCSGMNYIVQEALKASKKDLPVNIQTYTLQGELRPNRLF